MDKQVLFDISDNEKTSEKDSDEQTSYTNSSSSEFDEESFDESEDENSSDSQYSYEKSNKKNSLLEFAKQIGRKRGLSHGNESDSESNSDSDDKENIEFQEKMTLLVEAINDQKSHKSTTQEQKVTTSYLSNCAFPLTVVAGTALYCAIRPESIRESWEYMKNIPIPFPLVSLCLVSGYLVFRRTQSQDRNNTASELLLEKIENCQTSHTMLALQYVVNKFEINRNYKALKSEQKALKKKYKYFKQKIKSLEEQQKHIFVLDNSEPKMLEAKYNTEN